jgi:hypothetical protein
MNKYRNILSLVLLLSLFSCQEDNTTVPSPDTGKLKIGFHHLYNQEVMEYDTFKYFNEAGNQILFTELQYFISDVTLHYQDGSTYTINAWKDIHYVDSDIPETQLWDVYDSIPSGTCVSVTFTFGINEQKNQSFMFVNPPESLMFWPDILGGGYHYLKLNGKWVTPSLQVNPFNFHLGIGQIYDNSGNITGFVQNYFSIDLTDDAFTIAKNQETTIGIAMHVESWFGTPETWDFNFWGGDIMQNQQAMHMACENGMDAFSLIVVND